ncbi:DUF3006 domain-containing protein [Halanaerobaculum tunisiense]
MRAVIDKIVGDYGLLLVGPEKVELNVPKEELPSNIEEGDWLRLDFKLDKKVTIKRSEELEDLLYSLIDS